jgi:hypothetical protein
LFPRFFGITKTFRPVFSPAAADAVDEDDADDDDDDDAAADVELEPDELQAASRIDARASGTASPAVCLSFIRILSISALKSVRILGPRPRGRGLRGV